LPDKSYLSKGVIEIGPSSVISQLGRSSDTRAVDAAEDLTFLLDPMPDNAAATVRAGRGEPLYGAFKAVKNMAFSFDNDFESLVVVISADLAFSHL
jgi:hypothetical protein